MAATNPPPQAYTKETVSQAYEWLFEQPQNVREMASDLDTMVALFLQAKRRRSSAGISANPVSAKAFKDELKGLAENFKQFEPAGQASAPQAPPTPEPIMEAPQPHLQPQPAPTPQPQVTMPIAQQQMTSSSLTQLDKRSLIQVHKVMESLNLSSESETIRLLISLGYEKVREILPKN